jgi:hypothetical protein
MAYTFNPFTGKLDAVGSGGGGGVGATGATGIGTTGATGATGTAGIDGATGATGAVAPGGSVGAVDNSALRADVGTGIVQNSGLIIEDAIVSFAVTGVAATDIITATGSAFANGQPVRFTALTGGAGLNTTTNYYVINVSGDTFQVSTSIGGAASLFTTNITAGTLLTGHSVSTNVTLSENTTATNSDLVLTPKGTGAFILGPKPDGTATGGIARGAYAVDAQIERTSLGQVASGNNSVALGGRNTASGTNSISIGLASIASAESCIAIGGNSAQASAKGAIAIGGSSTLATAASAENAIALGFTSQSNRFGMFSQSCGRFSANGDAQRARFVLRCKTTTNTGVEMALDGGTTYLGIPSGKYLTGTINIAGIKSDGSATASYIRQFSIKNVAATTTLVGTVNTIGIDTASLTSISITANDASDYLSVQVTGIASETWRWVASVDVVEVAYGA